MHGDIRSSVDGKGFEDRVLIDMRRGVFWILSFAGFLGSFPE